jgi:hypothetical protein
MVSTIRKRRVARVRQQYYLYICKGLAIESARHYPNDRRPTTDPTIASVPVFLHCLSASASPTQTKSPLPFQLPTRHGRCLNPANGLLLHLLAPHLDDDPPRRRELRARGINRRQVAAAGFELPQKPRSARCFLQVINPPRYLASASPLCELRYEFWDIGCLDWWVLLTIVKGPAFFSIEKNYVARGLIHGGHCNLGTLLAALKPTVGVPIVEQSANLSYFNTRGATCGELPNL